jgi:hypothetical protein
VSVFLPFGDEARVQGFQPVEALAEGVIDFLPNVIRVALRVREYFGRLRCIPAFQGEFLNAREVWPC